MVTYYKEGEIHGQDKPFELTTGKATRDKRDKVDCPLNDQERKDLNEIKDILGIDMDATALKFCFDIGRKVLLQQVGSENLRYIASGRRTPKYQKKT